MPSMIKVCWQRRLKASHVNLSTRRCGRVPGRGSTRGLGVVLPSAWGWSRSRCPETFISRRLTVRRPDGPQNPHFRPRTIAV